MTVLKGPVQRRRRRKHALTLCPKALCRVFSNKYVLAWSFLLQIQEDNVAGIYLISHACILLLILHACILLLHDMNVSSSSYGICADTRRQCCRHLPHGTAVRRNILRGRRHRHRRAQGARLRLLHSNVFLICSYVCLTCTSPCTRCALAAPTFTARQVAPMVCYPCVPTCSYVCLTCTSLCTRCALAAPTFTASRVAQTVSYPCCVSSMPRHACATR